MLVSLCPPMMMMIVFLVNAYMMCMKRIFVHLRKQEVDRAHAEWKQRFLPSKEEQDTDHLEQD